MCIRDRQRGGIGRLLILEALDRLRKPGHTDLRLDVFEFNSLARAWYSRMGFQTESTTLWYQSAIRDVSPPASEQTVIHALPEALLALDKFGFGRFRISMEDRNYSVGILGDHWFRITDRAAYSDPAVHGILRTLDQKRDIIASWPADEGHLLSETSVRLVGRSFRMVSPIDTVHRALRREAGAVAAR